MEVNELKERKKGRTAVITIELFLDIFPEKALSTITTDFTAFISDSKAVHVRNIERG